VMHRGSYKNSKRPCTDRETGYVLTCGCTVSANLYSRNTTCAFYNFSGTQISLLLTPIFSDFSTFFTKLMCLLYLAPLLTTTKISSPRGPRSPSHNQTHILLKSSSLLLTTSQLFPSLQRKFPSQNLTSPSLI
jgi:hypothetical protein